MAETPQPLSPDRLADREWPGLRARILDIAATLDRLDRGGADAVRAEAESLLASLQTGRSTDRAEQLLATLSRGYDPAWRARFAAGETAADAPGEEG